MGAYWALKEWAIAVNALLAGDLILLVRKGGIRESRPVFEVPSDRPLLFPTYEHQKLEAICPAYREGFSAQSVPQIGATLSLPGWAEVTHQFLLTMNDPVEQLHPFHIWTDTWLLERLAWKPERPAYILLLRVHRFIRPLSITYQTHHRGCRSWIQLENLGELPESVPVLSNDLYEQRLEQVRDTLPSLMVHP